LKDIFLFELSNNIAFGIASGKGCVKDKKDKKDKRKRTIVYLT